MSRSMTQLQRQLRSALADQVKNSRLWAAPRDLNNRFRHGPQAPAYAEAIVVPTAECVAHTSELPGPGYSGSIYSGPWPFPDMPVFGLTSIRFCLRHWGDGLSWEATGAYAYAERRIREKGSINGCRHMHEVVARYRRLDAIFNTVRRDRRLRRISELQDGRLRAHGDIHMHIGPDGEPVFGGFGCHRLAMAMVLELPSIPAQVGCVHIDGLKHLARYRRAEQARVDSLGRSFTH